MHFPLFIPRGLRSAFGSFGSSSSTATSGERRASVAGTAERNFFDVRIATCVLSLPHNVRHQRRPLDS
jgi:hypothetical protein